MVDYTRQIQTATQTAAQTPVIQQPTSSLAGDLVNAASTGLQFYAQQQARSDLEKLTEAQAKQQARMSQGVLGLRELRQNLVNQGVSRSMLLQKEKEYLSRFGATERLSIIKGAKEATGQTLSTFSDEITEQQQRSQSLRSTLADLSAFLPSPPDLSGSDTDIQNQILFAQSRKAIHEKRKADATLRSAQLSNIEKERNLGAVQFLMDFGMNVGNNLTQQMDAYMDSVDFSNPQQVGELMRTVNQSKQQFIQAAMEVGASQGFVFSTADAQAQLATQLDKFDGVQKFLSRSDISTFTANERKNRVNAMVLAMESSENPKERELAKLMTLGEAFPNSPYLQSEITKLYTDSLLAGLSTPPPEKEDANRVYKFLGSIFKDPSETDPLTNDIITEMLVNDLQVSGRKQDSLINGGGLTAYVQSIAKGDPTKRISEEDMPEVLDGLMLQSQEFLRRAIPQMLNQEQLLAIEPREAPRGAGNRAGSAKGVRAVSDTGENAFNALDDNLKLTLTTGREMKGKVREYNQWVSNVFIAMEKLGATSEEIQEFKNRIKRSFNVASTE